MGEPCTRLAAARDIIMDALDEQRGDPLAPRVLAREAEAILTRLADFGFTVVVRRRLTAADVAAGDEGGWTDWPGPAARA